MVHKHWFAATEAYINEVTGIQLAWLRCGDPVLPLHIKQAFDFACAELDATEFVFALAQPWSNVTPAVAEKQAAAIRTAFGRPAVLILPDLPAWARRGFIERKLPFITPYRQMFLPNVGFDYRDRVTRHPPQVPDPTSKKRELTPSEQQVLLFMLIEPGVEFQADRVMNGLDVSRMTVSRAFRALEERGLIERPAEGRKRPAVMQQEKRVIWQAAQPFLRNPMRDSVLVPARELPFPDAGLTALAHLSSIAEPLYRTVATSIAGWRRWQVRNNTEELLDKPVPEAGDVLVELWAYEPEPLAHSCRVDPLSLHLTLRESQDERIEIARNEALEPGRWKQ